ncbi:MAG: hypothetical protein K0Q72_846, partial [Armatimonadetes bacterium]|nr:hypothetical protein [Armatimonadota bacterium]
MSTVHPSVDLGEEADSDSGNNPD